MSSGTIRRRTFELMADILEYPQPGLVEAICECAALLAIDNLAAAACMHEFGAFVRETPRGRLEEIYTSTFDLDAAWYPYVGYHLFGESYQRSVFMLGLNERYRAHDFTVAGELPDHLAVLLRFLAVCDDAVLSGEIVHEALLPALEHMDPWGARVAAPSPESCGGGRIPPLQSMTDKQQERARQGYWLVLHALQLVLQQFPVNSPPPESAPRPMDVTVKMRDSLPCRAKIGARTRKGSAETQGSVQRTKSACRIIAKRKASHQAVRALWFAGWIR